MDPIRVLQIVDSLRPGGTESMALNIANDLSIDETFSSFLVCTRQEGNLVERIEPSVTYLFLHKKRKLDVGALFRLCNFIKKNKIHIIHAHSTSFYYPVILKLFCSFKLIWHDHYGINSEKNVKRFYPYTYLSYFFDYAISVSNIIYQKNLQSLHVNKIRQIYLPNYSVNRNSLLNEHYDLLGLKENRTVCLANFTPAKDHEILFQAFQIVQEKIKNVVLYCIGAFPSAEREKEITSLIKSLKIKNVVLTGSVANPFPYLSEASIGVLSSKIEGLPLSLIEYGLAGLAVVCTDVGQCRDLIKNEENGFLIPPGNPKLLAKRIISLLEDRNLQQVFASNFKSYVNKNYSREVILPQFKKIYLQLVSKS